MTSLIIGGRTEAQFRDNLACVNVKLSDDERSRLDKVSQPAADLSLLAPVLDGEGPPRPRRPGAARALSEGVSTPFSRFDPLAEGGAAGRSEERPSRDGLWRRMRIYRLDWMWLRSTG